MNIQEKLDRVLQKLGYVPINRFMDMGHGEDNILIAEFNKIVDSAKHRTVMTVRRWNSEEDWEDKIVYRPELALEMFGGQPQFDIMPGNNALTNQGINEMWTILGSSGSGTKFDNTNANSIVGTGSGAADPGDTEATFTSGVKKVMDGSYPTYGTSQQIVFRSTYASGDANQAWNEFGILNAAASGDLMNRKVSSEGTKTSGQTWELTTTISLT